MCATKRDLKPTITATEPTLFDTSPQTTMRDHIRCDKKGTCTKKMRQSCHSPALRGCPCLSCSPSRGDRLVGALCAVTSRRVIPCHGSPPHAVLPSRASSKPRVPHARSPGTTPSHRSCHDARAHQGTWLPPEADGVSCRRSRLTLPLVTRMLGEGLIRLCYNWSLARNSGVQRQHL
jgi:hypothetical protein